MDCITLHRERETRGLLVERLGNAVEVAQQVRHQPGLTQVQREAVQWAIAAMLRAKREISRVATRGEE